MGCDVEIKGISNLNGIFAKIVGSAKKSEAKTITLKNKVFLSLLKKSAKKANISGKIPI